MSLYELGRSAVRVLAGDAAKVLPELLRAGGSPGGARPKVLVGLKGDEVISGEDYLPDDYEAWMVKFSAREEENDAGPLEYAYSLMALAAGIDMPPCKLLAVGKGTRTIKYFATKRFDRAAGNQRRHVHTFANLIHSNFRLASMDYLDLFNVTRALSRNHQDSLRLFRRMVFNVLAHNRDDHDKNFAFLLDSGTREWSLSPAYDLTFSSGPGGEQSMTVLGEGRNPKLAHCMSLAKKVGIRVREAEQIIAEVSSAIHRWGEFADEASVSKRAKSEVKGMLQAMQAK